MQADYPVEFSREQGCTEAQWLRDLAGAVGDIPWTLLRPGKARVRLDGGSLTLRWQPLPPRRLGKITLPRLSVHYLFDGVEAEVRRGFMRHFDLHLQRGGG